MNDTGAGRALPRARPRRWYAVATLCMLGLQASACLVGDEKCDENQRQVPGTNACTCVARHVPSARGYGCDPCGPNEEALGGMCVCAEGYSRSSDADPCQPVVGSARGASCSASAPCTGESSYCATSEPAPYCTTSCSRSADCPVSWRCVRVGADTFCKTPPTGLGDMCATHDDCAGKEASYCSSTVRSCLVNDCVLRPSECPNGSVCCDLRSAVGQSLCLATAAITEGNCPLTGMPPVSL